MSVLIYPGSFDPFTVGHLDIARRASRLCGTLYVAVLPNPDKQSAFTPEERVRMIEACVQDLPNVRVECHGGLLADYYRRTGAVGAVRGLRGARDVQYELEQAMGNRLFEPGYEVLFIPCRPDYSWISSSLVREVARLGGDISNLVPAVNVRRVRERLFAGEQPSED